MDVEDMRAGLRDVASDGHEVAHAERMEGVRAKVRREGRRRILVSAVAAAAAVAVAVPVTLGLREQPAPPALGERYDGTYPGPESFDGLAQDGTCPSGGHPGSGTQVPVGPDEPTDEQAAALTGPIAVALADAGGDARVVRVQRTATSLSPGSLPCGPSYGVLLGGTTPSDAEVLVTLSWAGDDRFGGLLRCAPDEGSACERREEDGWSATLREDNGRSGALVVVMTSVQDPDERSPVVVVSGLREGAPGVQGLLQVAVDQDWHRLAEEVEAALEN
jgi:hypothetical protein